MTSDFSAKICSFFPNLLRFIYFRVLWSLRDYKSIFLEIRFLRYFWDMFSQYKWIIMGHHHFSFTKKCFARMKATFPKYYSKGWARLCCMQFQFMDPYLSLCLFVNSDSNAHVISSSPHTLSPYRMDVKMIFHQ